ncbi:MAG TPA: hypothetical protein VGG37_01825 [Opitutaceae bacterium]|jgi:hypothetical protein
MIQGSLACPRCKAEIEARLWQDPGSYACPDCGVGLEVLPFPALTAPRTTARASTAILSEESICFFHPSNRGEVLCDRCGRILCLVCAINFSGKRLCPECIRAAQNSAAGTLARERVLYDRIALMTALAPLLVWPFTLLTSPFALFLAIYGWNKPGSLVRGVSRTAQVSAILLSVAQIIGWVVLFVYLAHRKHR